MNHGSATGVDGNVAGRAEDDVAHGENVLVVGEIAALPVATPLYVAHEAADRGGVGQGVAGQMIGRGHKATAVKAVRVGAVVDALVVALVGVAEELRGARDDPWVRGALGWRRGVGVAGAAAVGLFPGGRLSLVLRGGVALVGGVVGVGDSAVVLGRVGVLDRADGVGDATGSGAMGGLPAWRAASSAASFARVSCTWESREL